MTPFEKFRITFNDGSHEVVEAHYYKCEGFCIHFKEYGRDYFESGDYFHDEYLEPLLLKTFNLLQMKHIAPEE